MSLLASKQTLTCRPSLIVVTRVLRRLFFEQESCGWLIILTTSIKKLRQFFFRGILKTCLFQDLGLKTEIEYNVFGPCLYEWQSRRGKEKKMCWQSVIQVRVTPGHGDHDWESQSVIIFNIHHCDTLYSSGSVVTVLPYSMSKLQISSIHMWLAMNGI